MNNEFIEHDRVSQDRRSIQNRLNDFIVEVPLPPKLNTGPPPLVRSKVYRGNIYDDERELIGQRVLCSWDSFSEEERGIVNLQSGILKNIDFVNGKKYYYVDVDFKDDGGKIVTGVEHIMDYPAEYVRIEPTDSIVYPSTRDSSGHVTENEPLWLTQQKKTEEEQRISLQDWRKKAAKERGWSLNESGQYIDYPLSDIKNSGGKKRKTYKKHKKTQYKKTKKYRKRR